MHNEDELYEHDALKVEFIKPYSGAGPEALAYAVLFQALADGCCSEWLEDIVEAYSLPIDPDMLYKQRVKQATLGNIVPKAKKLKLSITMIGQLPNIIKLAQKMKLAGCKVAFGQLLSGHCVTVEKCELGFETIRADKPKSIKRKKLNRFKSIDRTPDMLYKVTPKDFIK